jgi:DNA-binding NarL/FixJ family response regulator
MLKVLIVDDEPLARLRLRTLLAECQPPACEVVGEAGDAAQALDWLSTHECDLLLLDVHMPGLDGTQLAAELRQRRRMPNTRSPRSNSMRSTTSPSRCAASACRPRCSAWSSGARPSPRRRWTTARCW